MLREGAGTRPPFLLCAVAMSLSKTLVLVVTALSFIITRFDQANSGTVPSENKQLTTSQSVLGIGGRSDPNVAFSLLPALPYALTSADLL